jgi:hypothetical protein
LQGPTGAFAFDFLEFRERGEGFEIHALPVTFWREATVGFNYSREVLDCYYVFV